MHPSQILCCSCCPSTMSIRITCTIDRSKRCRNSLSARTDDTRCADETNDRSRNRMHLKRVLEGECDYWREAERLGLLRTKTDRKNQIASRSCVTLNCDAALETTARAAPSSTPCASHALSDCFIAFCQSHTLLSAQKTHWALEHLLARVDLEGAHRPIIQVALSSVLSAVSWAIVVPRRFSAMGSAASWRIKLADNRAPCCWRAQDMSRFAG